MVSKGHHESVHAPCLTSDSELGLYLTFMDAI